MNTMLKKLYNKRVMANAITWANSVHQTPDCDIAQNYAEMDYYKSLKKFIAKHPDEPLSVHTSPFILPQKMEKMSLDTTTKLWNKYQDLKKGKSNPDAEYFKLFRKMINGHHEMMAFYGKPVSELTYVSDHAIGSYADVKSVIERMVAVHLDFIGKEHSPKNHPRKIFTAETLSDYVDAIEGVEAIFSNKNGSYMMGLDENNSRIHIFDEKDIDSVAGSTFHEVGHALYQNHVLNKHDIGKFGGCVSLSLHESCSLYFELCLSNHAYAVDVGNFNNCKRLSSDRIHYIFHIYIRMLVEEEILNGTLKVTDIHDRWNELVKQYIGLDITDPWDGFMQDVHWNSGMIGYFPSYAIGLLNASVKYQSTKHLLSGDPLRDTYDVLIPCIDSRYGKYGGDSTNILADLNIDMDAYKDFVFENFYKV